MTKHPDLASAVRRFFEILDTVEVSDSDREFHPVTISSCRVLMSMELKDLLPQMKKFAEDLDPIQNNCKYGYVLPDRCRYIGRNGCDCGAYPPLKEPVK